MTILDNVLYDEILKLNAKIDSMEEELGLLPKGCIYIRKSCGSMYVYRKWREDDKICAEYLGKLDSPKTLAKINKVNEYKILSQQIKKEKVRLAELKKAYKLLLTKTHLN